MSRINNNLPSLIAVRNLASDSRAPNTSLERLATGLRINRASDNDAGLFAGENLAEKNAIEQAIAQVSALRGRMGAIQADTLDTNVNRLNVALANATAAESVLRDADFAAETARLTRNQILVQAAASVLRAANAMPQNVLALLG